MNKNTEIGAYDDVEELFREEAEKMQRMEEMAIQMKMDYLDEKTYRRITHASNPQQYDYIVIGSGPGGALCAVTLAGKLPFGGAGKKVLVIESGKRRMPFELYAGKTEKQLRKDNTIFKPLDDKRNPFEKRPVDFYVTDDVVPKEAWAPKAFGGGSTISAGYVWWQVPQWYVTERMVDDVTGNVLVDFTEFDAAGAWVNGHIGSVPTKFSPSVNGSPVVTELKSLINAADGLNLQNIEDNPALIGSEVEAIDPVYPNISRVQPKNGVASHYYSMYATKAGQLRRTNAAHFLEQYEYDNLHILCETEVTEITKVMSVSNTVCTANGVSVTRTKDDFSETLHIGLKAGGEVIVAGGTYNTPAILQASGIGNAAYLTTTVGGYAANTVVNNIEIGENLVNNQWVHGFSPWMQTEFVLEAQQNTTPGRFYSDVAMVSALRSADANVTAEWTNGIMDIETGTDLKSARDFQVGIGELGAGTIRIYGPMTSNLMLNKSGTFGGFGPFPVYDFAKTEDRTAYLNKIYELKYGIDVATNGNPGPMESPAVADPVANPGDKVSLSFEHTGNQSKGYVRIMDKDDFQEGVRQRVQEDVLRQQPVRRHVRQDDLPIRHVV